MKFKGTKFVQLASLIFLLGYSACSEVTMKQLEDSHAPALTNEFENQKGHMQPAVGYETSFTGCRYCAREKKSIFETHCCFSQNDQSYTSVKSFLAKAVASGIVVKVKNLKHDGIKWVVIVRHGAYITVYINLDHIKVVEGQSVSPGSDLGAASSNFDETKKEFVFKIYNGQGEVYPKEWLEN